MGARRVLIGLIIAFGISVTVATVTTIRQVHMASSSVSQPIRHI